MRASKVCLAVLLAFGVTLSANAQDEECPPGEEGELCVFDRERFAAGAYARCKRSVAILFHIGDDVRARENVDEVMTRVRTHFEEQFQERGIIARTFSSANYNSRATGLTYYYGDGVFGNSDGVIDFNLQEGLDLIPSVAESLGFFLQTDKPINHEACARFGY